MNMNKKTIITILLALAAVVGQAQVKCHIEGKFINDKWGDDVVICKMGTDLPSMTHRSYTTRL